jgi:hypothetical protein
VSAVLRRHAVRLSVRVTVIALAAAAATGCTTFSDNDVVARFGDTELSSDELAESLIDVTTNSEPPAPALDDDGGADGEASREAVTNWILEELVDARAFDEQYAADPAVLGVTCIDVAIAVDRADADALLARLDAGEPWDDVVAPIEQAIGYESEQPCQPLAVFADALGDEVAERLAEIKPGEPPRVIDAGESGGFAVMRAQELDVIEPEELLAAVAQSRPPAFEALLAEIYVDPRVGSFDTASFTVVAVD